ncbi:MULTISPECIES: hypothetical protein [unclassified Mesorhizobium]|uniref:hypothetical protein n=1 Tax=unclassified Mesorhizobium TaxID=325217 RepID=UPI0033365372
MENANDGHEALRFEKYGQPSAFSLQESPGVIRTGRKRRWTQPLTRAAAGFVSYLATR